MEILAITITALVLIMKAVGVPYASELNLASKTFGVDQALMQSIIDVSTSEFNISGLSDDEAIRYARSYARKNGHASLSNDGGMFDPESNIMAMAWHLNRLNKKYNGWLAVKAYFGIDPVGEAITRRINFQIYPTYKKRWE